jgi:predicted enzyme related to lactoylglutathione lyase
MGKVLGVGGVFFKAEDPKAVCDWYSRVLGFDMSQGSFTSWPHPADGYSVWSAFSASTDYFKPSDAPFMVNLVVEDLDGLLTQVRAAGVEPIGEDYADQTGKFAWLIDPAGVKVELWEPPKE